MPQTDGLSAAPPLVPQELESPHSRGPQAVSPVDCRASPSLLNQKRQVVHPVLFINPARIDQMCTVVLGVCDNKIRVRNGIVPVGSSHFPGSGNCGGPFYCLDRGFGSRQTNKTLIEMIQSPAQDDGIVTCRVRRNKNELHPIRNAARQFL